MKEFYQEDIEELNGKYDTTISELKATNAANTDNIEAIDDKHS